MWVDQRVKTPCCKSTGVCFLTDSPGGEQRGFLIPFIWRERETEIPLFTNW